jgi:8-oxo-dGTP pyrophosphatase MutT (NUDIX family)
MASEPDLRVTIAAHLKSFERKASSRPQTPAAVAIVVLDGGSSAAVPMFQRPLNMTRHPGQMALPGGKLHDGDTAEDCAIRELREELGLVVDSSSVLGGLDDFETVSGFTITPVVIWSEADASALTPSSAEVKRLFVVTTSELREAAAAATPGSTPKFSLKFRQVEVFAPTAAILYQFSEVALDGRPCRVADFYQPPWTHR